MKRIQRILALAGTVLLVVMYLLTLLSALLDQSSSMFWFRASVTCTILVPILLWGYTVIYRLAKGKDEKELQETLEQIEADEIKADQIKADQIKADQKKQQPEK